VRKKAIRSPKPLTWIEPFSPREIEILNLISEGKSNGEIAQKILISIETVKWYNKQIFSKLGVGSRTEALAKAREYRLLELQETASVDEAKKAVHNLPAALTSFVGRVSEIAEIKELLKTNRLLVLTGTGGSGKTRLALRVAKDMIGYYRD
jgi:DNA-binding CsgD family transcriptional regulator